MTEESIKLRSLGWAKYEIENRNRFQPQGMRAQERSQSCIIF